MCQLVSVTGACAKPTTAVATYASMRDADSSRVHTLDLIYLYILRVNFCLALLCDPESCAPTFCGAGKWGARDPYIT